MALGREQASHSQGPQRPVRGGSAEPLFQGKAVGFYIRARGPRTLCNDGSVLFAVQYGGC